MGMRRERSTLSLGIWDLQLVSAVNIITVKLIYQNYKVGHRLLIVFTVFSAGFLFSL